jgi:hypothetical protein
MTEITIIAITIAAIGAFYNSTKIIKNQEIINQKLSDIKDSLKTEK